MIRMTFQEYDDYIHKFNNINCKHIWPTPVHLEKMEESPEKWIIFACFLLETNPEPKNNTEKYSKKNLHRFVTKNLELVDEESEKGE